LAILKHLKNPDNYLQLNSLYQEKRDIFNEAIKGSRFKAISCYGTYFQLLEYSNITNETDIDFSVRLIKEFGIASIPVSVFYKQNPVFLFSEFFHFLLFSKKTPWFNILVKFAKFLEKHPYLKRIFTSIEYFFKTRLYNCQECGDCTLYELNYNCPQSGCAKYLLNGPCGGSINGYCEAFPFEKKCFYIKALENSFFKKNVKKLLVFEKSYFIPPRNWELNKTSSWLNFYLGRDHTGSSES